MNVFAVPREGAVPRNRGIGATRIQSLSSVITGHGATKAKLEVLGPQKDKSIVLGKREPKFKAKEKEAAAKMM